MRLEPDLMRVVLLRKLPCSARLVDERAVPVVEPRLPLSLLSLALFFLAPLVPVRVRGYSSVSSVLHLFLTLRGLCTGR